MKIVMLSDWFFYYTARIANELSVLGHEVTLVTRDHGSEIGVDGDSEPAKRSMLAEEVTLIVLRGRQGSVRGVISMIAVLLRCMVLRPAVVHAQYHYDWRLEVIRRALRRPSVVTVHDVTSHLGARVSRNAVQVWAERSLLTRCNGFIVHGDSLREDLRDRSYYQGQPVFSIPHGPLVHPVAQVSPLPKVPTALFFGRLEEYKGLHEFVDACRDAARAIPDLRCVIAGHGTLAELLSEWIDGDPRFDVRIGFVPDDAIPTLLAECSVVVLPYLEASQSGVIPLAYSNGRAVIASRIGALPEAIDDGETGWLVPAGDRPALAAAIVDAFSHPALLRDAGDRAWHLVTVGRLSASFVASEHIAAYGEIVKAH